MTLLTLPPRATEAATNPLLTAPRGMCADTSCPCARPPQGLPEGQTSGSPLTCDPGLPPHGPQTGPGAPSSLGPQFSWRVTGSHPAQASPSPSCVSSLARRQTGCLPPPRSRVLPVVLVPPNPCPRGSSTSHLAVKPSQGGSECSGQAESHRPRRGRREGPAFPRCSFPLRPSLRWSSACTDCSAHGAHCNRGGPPGTRRQRRSARGEVLGEWQAGHLRSCQALRLGPRQFGHVRDDTTASGGHHQTTSGRFQCGWGVTLRKGQDPPCGGSAQAGKARSTVWVCVPTAQALPGLFCGAAPELFQTPAFVC